MRNVEILHFSNGPIFIKIIVKNNDHDHRIHLFHMST